jgi:glycosyltransferase involved in cell wall biosynthesis
MHVVWLNEFACGKGGAERYVRETAAHLAARGVRSTLLYDVKSPVDEGYLAPFSAAYPALDPVKQIRGLGADLVYVHRLADEAVAGALCEAPAPVVRFFHHYEIFCPREHKYTALGHRACTRSIGAHCYTCLGFVRRAPSFPYVKLVTVGSLRRAHRASQPLTAFVVGSTFMAEHVAAHGFDREKIHVLPLYAAPKEATSAAREPDLVLFVGQLIRGKGVDHLLRAFARTRRRARLVIAGDGKQRREFEALSSRLCLDRRASFVGWVEGAALEQLYARACCVVMPSRFPETFGLAGVEAMAAGAPVIASDLGGVREWLRPEDNGIAVPSGDVDALARANDRLVDDGELARAMGRRARATHQERFLPEHHVGRLHALFLRLAGGAGGDAT